MTVSRVVLFAACIAGALALVSASNAGDCRVASAAPVVTVPVKSVYNPTILVGGHDVVKVKELIVPILQPLPFFVDPRISYVYTGGNYIAVPQVPVGQAPPVAHPPQPQAQTPPAGNGDVNIDALIDRIEQRVRERQGQQAPEPSSGPPPVPGFQKQGRKSPEAIVQAHCASCHTGPSSKGGFVIFDAPGQFSASFDSAAAVDAIKDGRMPPANKPRLSNEDFRTIVGQ